MSFMCSDAGAPGCRSRALMPSRLQHLDTRPLICAAHRGCDIALKLSRGTENLSP